MSVDGEHDFWYVKIGSPYLTGVSYGAALSGAVRGGSTTVAWRPDNPLPLPIAPTDGLRLGHAKKRGCDTWCPCCKRWLRIDVYTSADAWLSDQWAATPAEAARPYAYVSVLWGASPGLVLAALVLGAGLICSATKYDRVL